MCVFVFVLGCDGPTDLQFFVFLLEASVAFYVLKIPMSGFWLVSHFILLFEQAFLILIYSDLLVPLFSGFSFVSHLISLS